MEVICFTDDPVDGRLATPRAATLTGGLGEDDFLCFVKAVHGHAFRCHEWRLHFELIILLLMVTSWVYPLNTKAELTVICPTKAASYSYRHHGGHRDGDFAL